MNEELFQSSRQTRALASVEAFMREVASIESPLAIEPVDSELFVRTINANSVRVDFFWNEQNPTLRDRVLNPLELKVIKPLVELMGKLAFPAIHFDMHSYLSGYTGILFSKSELDLSVAKAEIASTSAQKLENYSKA